MRLNLSLMNLINRLCVEQFIRGREFAVGLLGNNPVETFPVLEFDLDNDPDAIQSVDHKKYQPRQKICPASLSQKVSNEMIRLSIEAFKALQLRDFARVDIRMDENENIYLLEINSMASLGKTGSYVYSANVAGYNYETLVNKMLDVAAVRYFANSSLLANGELRTKGIPFHVRVRGYLRSKQNVNEMLLKQMVNLNTHIRNVESVNSLGNLIKKELSVLGFSVESIPQVELGNILFFTNSDQLDYDILFIGNLDDSVKISQQEYFRVSNQRLYGSGIWEHKGGLVTMIAGLQSLRFIRRLNKTRIGILLTTDDTLYGRFAKSIIQMKSQQAKFVLGLHGGNMDGSVVTSRSGAALYKSHLKLKDTENAHNVSLAASVYARLLLTWTQLSDAESGLVISPYRCEMDTNITSPFANGEVTLSVRFNDSDQMQKIDVKIKDSTPQKKYKNIIDFQMEGGVRRPSMLRSAEVGETWNIIKSIADKLDIRLLEEHRWSSADICFIDDGKHKIDGLGPIGAKPTEKSEFIVRHNLIERATLIAMTILELHKNLNK